MREAKNLEDLLLIRQHNQARIKGFTGNLGSALGYKRVADKPLTSCDPAIIIFVPRKVRREWLPDRQRIPKTMSCPEGIRCKVDVVEGGKYEEVWFDVRDDGGNRFEFARSDLLTRPPITEANLRLLELLRGWNEHICPGSQLAGYDDEGSGYYGTLGCIVRDSKTKALGLLTNQHVASYEGNTLWYAEESTNHRAIVERQFEWVEDDDRFPGTVDIEDAYYTIDCAYAKFEVGVRGITKKELDPRLLVGVRDGIPQYRTLGNPLRLDLSTMGPIGKPVLAIGRTRGLERGTIVAFGYEWSDDNNELHYTDYLIAGEDGTWFGDYGDSGKLIVTDDGNYSPVALFWGSWWETLANHRGQDSWNYAIDINFILKKLAVEITQTL